MASLWVCWSLAWVAPMQASGTAEAVQELLQQLWEAPADQVVKRGTQAVGRSQKKRSDPSLVYFAQAILYLQHGHTDPAENAFTSAVKLRTDFTPARIGLAMSQARLGNHDGCIKTLQQGIDHPPFEPALAQAVAVLKEFYGQMPPPKLRAELLAKLDEATRAGLNEQSRPLYESGASIAKQYLAGLPKLRELLQEPLVLLQNEADRIAADGRNLENRIDTLDRQIVDSRRFYAATEADLARQLANLDSSIRILEQQMNIGQSAALRTTRVQTAINGQARLTQIQQDIQRMLAEQKSAANERQNLLARHKQQLKQIELEQKKVEQNLAAPPLFDVTAARNQMVELARTGALPDRPVNVAKTESDPPAAPTETKPADSNQEAKAASELKQAKSLIDNDRKDKAKPYLQRVIEKYPDTAAAAEPKSLLEQLAPK